MTAAGPHTITATLIPRTPFDFAKTLHFIDTFAPMEGEQTLTADSFTKALALDGQAIAFTVRASRSDIDDQPRLAVTLHSAQPLSDTTKAAALDRIRFFLSLDDDLTSFYATARQDSAFAPVVQQLYGLHQVKFLTPFEIACWAVLIQRTPIGVARGIKQKLVERYGCCILVGDATHWAFPEPQTLATADPADLAALVGNVRKADYLAAVTHFFSTVDEHWLRTGPYDEVAARTLAIRGIGAWSANFILIRGLGRVERVPVAEGALDQAIARIYGPLTPAELQAIHDRYGSMQGYWAYYLRNATL